MTTELWSKENLLGWHEPSVPLGHEIRRPQAASRGAEGGVHTFCWRRPAAPGAKPCAAPPHPWGARWGALRAPPPCTPDTWRSRRTGSRSPSPADDTRVVPVLGHWPSPDQALGLPQHALSKAHSLPRMWTVLHPASQEKRKDKLLCDRSQTEVDRTPGQLLQSQTQLYLATAVREDSTVLWFSDIWASGLRCTL